MRHPNQGVSAARNHGLDASSADYVLVLDGDDTLHPSFLHQTYELLERDPSAKAASSWLKMFGVATASVHPRGGDVRNFLTANSSPACVLLRMESVRGRVEYDESMREGFEDWDFFLSLLTTGGHIAIVEQELINYRTAPASANIASMTKRSRLYAFITNKHHEIFAQHWRHALLESEAHSTERLLAWENLAVRSRDVDLSTATYGDGGMASIVRVSANRSI